MEVEQKTYAEADITRRPNTDRLERISGLKTLLEGAPSLPERKMSWHCALEKLLDGTRDGLIPSCAIEIRDRLTTDIELQTRIEEMEALENRMETVGVSIAKAVSEGILIVNWASYPLGSGNIYS